MYLTSPIASQIIVIKKKTWYTVTCVILQRTGAGFYAGSSVIWDKNNDGSYRVDPH